LVGYVNEATANLTLLVFLTCVVFMSHYAIEILDSDDWVFRLEVLLSFIMFVGALHYAADANDRVIHIYIERDQYVWIKY